MPNRYGTYSLGHSRITRIVKLLLIVNAGVFLLELISGGAAKDIIYWWGLTPTLVRQGYIWQLFTYMFLHGGFFHLFFNMFVLWMFGCEIERSWGSKEFLKYYIITGVGAGILSFILSFNSEIPTIGASGAIFGILVAYALLFPNRLIYVWFLFPVKAKYLVGFFAVFTLISSFRHTGDGIAHFAHLGGMLIGYIYIRADWKTRRFGRAFRFLEELKHKRKLENISEKQEEEKRILEQVDQILDKINAQGIDSLSNKEKKVLEKASHLLSRR